MVLDHMLGIKTLKVSGLGLKKKYYCCNIFQTLFKFDCYLLSNMPLGDKQQSRPGAQTAQYLFRFSMKISYKTL